MFFTLALLAAQAPISGAQASASYRVIEARVRGRHAVVFDPLTPIDWRLAASKALPGRDLQHPDSAWLMENLEPAISAAWLVFEGPVPPGVTREFYAAVGLTDSWTLQVDSISGQVTYELRDNSPYVEHVEYSGGLQGSLPSSVRRHVELPFVIWTAVPTTFHRVEAHLAVDTARGTLSVTTPGRALSFTLRKGGLGTFISGGRVANVAPDRVGAFASDVLPLVLVFSWPADDICAAEFQIWDVAREPKFLKSRAGSCGE